MSQSIADFRIRSMMCAPLLDSNGNSFGALQIDTLDQRSRFQPEDLEVHASVASQAAVAIVTAQLHEAALRQREIERDLELAQTVQKGFLPERPPTIEGYHFFDFYRARAMLAEITLTISNCPTDDSRSWSPMWSGMELPPHC